MCGIVGSVGKLLAKDDKIFEQLLIVDSLRGIDSTGILSVGTKNDYGIAKQVGDPYNLFNDRRYAGAMAGTNRVLLGHNRWATAGKVNRANAHPFETDNLIGVHNGTLDNKHALDEAHRFAVDSENLLFHMDKHGVHDAIGLVRGAWSLVWWEKEARRLNWLRNKERPMNFTWNEEETILYFASEAWMLKGVLARNDVKHKDVWELKTDTWLSMHVADDGKLSDIQTEEVKGAPPFQHQNTRVTHLPKTTSSSQTAGTNSTATSTTKGTSEKQSRSTETGASESTEQKAPLFTAPWEDGEAKIDVAYSRARRVEFEYICKARDENGQDYCILFDEKHPSKHVRLYLSSAHNLQIQPEGTHVKGDICQVVTSVRGIYYKVSPYSITMEQDWIIPEEEEFDDEVEVGDIIDALQMPDPLCKDECGSYMTKSAWLQLYPTCDGCGDVWEPDEPECNEHRFNTEKNIFCSKCVTDYTGYVQFI
jgi:hypothetical protein